ncbi:MAG: hypothetical protein ACHQHN_08245 [Sphingobacteriales bacterium]
MLKASALYIVIIISLVIGVICAALIATAYFYKAQYQKKFRYDQLQNNLSSGINILMASEDTTLADGETLSLFGTGADSVMIRRIPWGIYDVGIAMAFIQKDTLFKTFSIANTIDSSKWAALYVIDEDRPLSLSGKTSVNGDAFIPKAGVTTAYVDNKAYQGDQRLVTGHKYNSAKKLPQLDQKRLDQLNRRSPLNDSTLLKRDSVRQSFLRPTRYVNFKKRVQTIGDIKLSGNIVLLSDTTITIDSTAHLSDILIFAKTIVVKEGFRGNAQLFATDSVSIQNNCRFDYPSCAGILRCKPASNKSQGRITLGQNTDFDGILFTYEKTDNPLKPTIALGKHAKVTGQVYSQGIVELKDSTEVDGSVFTSRFLYRNSFTLYENYLINTTLNSNALSQYYLTSELLPVSKKKKKILQWLEAN